MASIWPLLETDVFSRSLRRHPESGTRLEKEKDGFHQGRDAIEWGQIQVSFVSLEPLHMYFMDLLIISHFTIKQRTRTL